MFGSSLEEAVDIGFDADVGLNGNGCALFFTDGFNYFFGGELVAEIVDADTESARSSQASGGGSDAAAGAGDDENLGMVDGHVRGF